MGFEYSLKIDKKEKKKVFVQRTNFHGVGEGVEGEMVSYTGERLGMVYLSTCLFACILRGWVGGKEGARWPRSIFWSLTRG
jgi:hypothetical protein